MSQQERSLDRGPIGNRASHPGNPYAPPSIYEESFKARGRSPYDGPPEFTRDRTRTSPLRGSNSPTRGRPGATAADNVYERSFVAHQSEPFPQRRYPIAGPPRNDSEEGRWAAERSISGPRKGGFSPTKIEVTHGGFIPPPIPERRLPTNNPLETACRVDDLLREIEDLKIQRDHFAKEADMERVKNRELEDEFHVLRTLIAENNKPVGYEENMALKHQFHHEREMRIHAENDVNRLRA